MDTMAKIRETFISEVTNAIVKYTDSMVDLVRHATIADLASESSPLSVRPPASGPAVKDTEPTTDFRVGRPVRQPDKIVDRILSILSANPHGLPTMALREAVNAAQSDYARAVDRALKAGQILKIGHKRGTQYRLNVAERPTVQTTAA